MLPPFLRHWLIALILLSQIGAPQAQVLLDPLPDGNDHVWDCWISSGNARIVDYYIRCIRDREIAPPEPPPDSTQAVLLDMIHERIHRNEAIEIDKDLNAGRLNEVLAHIWRIRIHQYPSETSWEQQYPQQLAQVLCRKRPDCAVLLFR